MTASSQSLRYQIPAQTITVELEVKRSRFVADISPAPTRTDALAFIEYIKAAHPDARHHCWAYIAGHPQSSIERSSSDDGEPQGTAGKPMLNVLQYKNIGEIVVVISRYFGGIKLGSGGLVRAYSSAVQLGVDKLPLTFRIPMRMAVLHIPFALESPVRRLLHQMDISIRQVNYHDQAIFTLELPCGDEESLSQSLIHHTNGAAIVIFP